MQGASISSTSPCNALHSIPTDRWTRTAPTGRTFTPSSATSTVRELLVPDGPRRLALDLLE